MTKGSSRHQVTLGSPTHQLNDASGVLELFPEALGRQIKVKRNACSSIPDRPSCSASLHDNHRRGQQ